MNKKILSIFLMVVVIVFTFANVYAAEGMVSINAYEDIYRLSEQNNKITIPFFNVFAKAATYDKDVLNSGISIANSTIDVNEKLEGIQLIFSQDMVTIKGEVEHALIYANNIVVEGKITGDSLLIANSVQILKDAVVERDVVISAGDLKLEGTLNGNVIASTSAAKITGTIAKDLRMVAVDVNMENEYVGGEIYIETDSDMSYVTSKYPDAKIVQMSEEDDENAAANVMSSILKGIVTVVIYSLICLLLTKKENNIVTKAISKFRDNTVFGILLSVVAFMLLIVLPIVLIILAVVGLGVIAWPILIAYLGIILFTISTSTFIVGTAIYEALKDKVAKFKYVVMVGIFAILYALTKITFIQLYVSLAINLIALAIVAVYITKKAKISEV